MTWQPSRDDAAEKARFIELHGEDLWNQIQDLGKPKSLAAREVFKPRKPAPDIQDRPALQTEDSDDPEWWDKK